MLFLVLILATFLDGFDESAVALVLPNISSHFDVDTADTSWIVTLYFLFMAAIVLIVGKICIRGGAKKIMMAGFLSFAVGGALGFLSPSFELLLVARSLQGIGASMLWCSVGIIAVMHLSKNRLALGLAAAMAGESLGCVVGPILGGHIAQYLSWEYVFIVTVPIGLLAILIVDRVVPRERFEGFDGFDFIGAILLFASLFSGMYCIETATYDGVTNDTLVAISIFLVTMPLFLLRIKRIDDPLVDVELFHFPDFKRLLVLYLIVMMCGMGLNYANVIYMSVVLGYTTSVSGTVWLMSGICTLIVCSFSGKLVIRYGDKPFIVLCCILAFLSGFSFLIPGIPALAPSMMSAMAIGILWGFVDVSIGSRLVNSVSDEHRAAASAMDTFFCYLGVAMGSALYFSLITLGSNSSGIPIDEMSSGAFMDGLMLAVSIGVVLSIIALLLALSLKKIKNTVPSDENDLF